MNRIITVIPPTFFMELFSFVNFSIKIVSLNNSKSHGDIFMKLGTDNVQRITSVRPSTDYTELCPFINCDPLSPTLMFGSVILKTFEILS